MRVGYFIGSFPYMNLVDDVNYFKRYHHGGAEVAAYYLAFWIAKRQHEVNVFSTSINGKNTFEQSKGMNIYRYGTNFRIATSNISFGLLQNPLKHNMDVVHTHSPIQVSDVAALRFVKKRNVPFVITYHGDGQEIFGGFVRKTALSFYNKYVLDKVLSGAEVIISPSKYYINESRFLGKYRDKIVVIPNGVNIADFEIPYSKEECRTRLGLSIDKKIVLFVGSLTPYKGPDVLVKAMSRMVKGVLDTELVFVGSGKMRSELLDLSKRLDVDRYVKFVGFVEERLKPLYYKAADVFVLPSTMNTEVHPIVLLEASASGLPMVVSDLDTFRCIIEDGYNSIVTKRGDEKSLAEAIIYLLENEEVRTKMGKNARNQVEDYSWERIAEETEKVYNEVIG